VSDTVTVKKCCPLCRRTMPPRQEPATLIRLEAIGGEWTELFVGSSRWHCQVLRRRFPGWEFRHHRISLLAGDAASYRIEARRRAA
jgi:hypothetical protein